MMRCWIVLAAVSFFAFPLRAQEPQATAVDEIDAHIARVRSEWGVPGLAVGIVKDGKVLLSKGYGVRELGKEGDVDGDTLFAIASNSKAFTAACIAILAENGKLRWNDRVQRHLPWLRLYDPYVSAELRIDDLLCHRSGLGTFSGDLLWWGTQYSPEDVLRRARHLKPAGRFRADYGYSNLMFLAAGKVIADVSGITWQEFVRERILAPVGMNRTVTSTSALEKQQNVATPHKPKPDSVAPIPWYNWDTMAAAGGIISSTNDMSKWLRVQLDHGRIDGERRLFSEASSHKMWSAHTIIPISRSSRKRNPHTNFRAYGLGWGLADYKGRKTVSHGGGYDGMYSRVVMVPEEKLGVVVLTNSMTGISTAIANHIIDEFVGGVKKDWSAIGLKRDRENRVAFYERIEKAVRPKVSDTHPSHDLEGFCGHYSGNLYGTATVSKEGEGLVLRLLPNKDLVADLTHLHYDTFRIDWRKEHAWFGSGTVQFLMDENGRVNEARLNVPNDDLWFHELELKRN